MDYYKESVSKILGIKTSSEQVSSLTILPQFIIIVSLGTVPLIERMRHSILSKVIVILVISN